VIEVGRNPLPWTPVTAPLFTLGVNPGAIGVSNHNCRVRFYRTANAAAQHRAVHPMTMPPTPRVTLTQVAARAGVSRTTASSVTTGRNDMRISVDAQQRVLRAARDLGYRPSLLARSLRTNRSQTIGLFSDGITADPLTGKMIRGSITSALLHEHLLFIAETTAAAGVEKRLVDNMLDRGVSGFLYASTYTRRIRVSAGLRAQPLVLVNCTARAGTVPTVIPDEREAGRAAARDLLRHGHTDRIVIVCDSPPNVQAAGDRVFGVQQALAGQGLVTAGTIGASWAPQPAFEAVGAYLADRPRPSALICLNDRIALGAYQACRDAGLAVPDDISIVSFDDSDLALWLRPQLTSVAVPHFEMGRRAVEILLSELPAPDVHLVPMTLRERASVGPPARRRQAGRVPVLRQPMVAVSSGVVTPLPRME
jgi:LacI family transcriptional regulator